MLGFCSFPSTIIIFRLLDLGLKVLAMAGSACVNPILYCWSNESIRGELLASIRQRKIDVYMINKPVFWGITTVVRH